MTTTERVLLWLAIVFLIYLNYNSLTEDEVSDIAFDVASNEIKYAGFVTEDVLEEEYVTVDAVNEALGKISNRLLDAEYNITNNGEIIDLVQDLDFRVSDLELAGLTKEERVKRMNKTLKKHNR